VVQHGQVIYSHGFGLRDVNKNLPVTPKTLFAIGSTTKSFTSLSMGILNDEGKLDWDKPVRQYLPEFQMYDPVASERMTPRDLITHRTGLAGHDFVWYSSDFSREDLIHRFRFLQSNRDFRSGYRYNNMLVMTAGYLVGKISGQGWEEFVRQHIWQPLGMTSSNFSVLDSQKTSDFAQPYRKDEAAGVVNQIPFYVMQSIGPAGSINSNVEDMARYAMFQLGKGTAGGKQIVSESNLNLTHTPQVPMGGGQQFKEIGAPSYGMGWVITSYRGHRMVWHNGGIDGFYALVSMLPDDDVAVVILTNLLGHPVPEVVAYNIYDRLLGLDNIDWAGRFRQSEDKDKAAEEQGKKTGATGQKAGTHPSHDLKDYAGRYENAGYGTLTVEPAGGGLTVALNKISAPLEHYHYDVFQIPEKAHWLLGGMKLRFLTNMDGDIDSIAMPLESDAPEIIFTRAAQKLSRETLAPLAGDYALGETVVSVALRGDDLQLTVPGDTAHTLVPQTELKFSIQGLEGYSVEFRKDEAGRVNELVFFQPNGTFVAKRKPAP
jgi:CubicO group peptidase (beta-lactamase class C family)